MPIFLQKVKVFFQSAGGWLKRHWKWAVGGISLMVLFFLTVRAISKGRAGKLKTNILKHQVAVLAVQNEVSRLEGKREVIRTQEGEVSGEIKELDAKIEELNSRIEAFKGEIGKLTAEEKLQRFKELGY